MDSNKASTANENVNSLFKSSTSVVDTVCDENNWSGSASESFNTQMTDFIGTYNNVITQQLELYEDAVKDYDQYEKKKTELAEVQAQIAAADEDDDTSALEAQAAALEAEINQLRATITATLATIESVNIDEADATTNIKEGLDELIEALASFNPEDLSTNGANGYISNLLNIPYYMQTDERWANYISMVHNQSFYEYGCGYTSLAMILCGLKSDKSITPRTVNDYLKAEADTDGDGHADSYVDINGDGEANINDVLSLKSGGDGLIMDTVTKSEFMEHYGVNVEEVYEGDLQDIMDQGRPCLVGTDNHYLVLAPGNNTYTDASGTHRTTVVYDPSYLDDTKEYEGVPGSTKNAGKFGTFYAFSNAE